MAQLQCKGKTFVQNHHLSTKYLDQDHLDQFRIDFAQLPFEFTN